jgi:hypothetical protein
MGHVKSETIHVKNGKWQGFTRRIRIMLRLNSFFHMKRLGSHARLMIGYFIYFVIVKCYNLVHKPLVLIHSSVLLYDTLVYSTVKKST